MRALGLEARGRVRVQRVAAVEAEAVEVAGARRGHRPGEVATSFGRQSRHRQAEVPSGAGVSLEDHLHPPAAGCPDPEVHAAGDRLGADR